MDSPCCPRAEHCCPDLSECHAFSPLSLQASDCLAAASDPVSLLAGICEVAGKIPSCCSFTGRKLKRLPSRARTQPSWQQKRTFPWAGR